MEKIYPNKHLELGGWCSNPEVWGVSGPRKKSRRLEGCKIPTVTPPLQVPLSSAPSPGLLAGFSIIN